jgi:ABC-type branched-subunit amino acid transport system ATPase component/branched-subunit amino acid ABC-type transport system permease component
MTEVLEFAVLGLGAGSAYALLSQGIVVIYQGSGVLNFAQGSVAMSGGYFFYYLHVEHGWGVVPATILACLLGALLGALIYQIVMRRLKNASGLARVIGTLGVLLTLQAAATLIFTSSDIFVQPFLPKGEARAFGLYFGYDRMTLLGLALFFTAALGFVYYRTTFGLATRAAATNRLAASTLGWSTDVLGTANWALGSLLAALAGVLLVPFTGLQPETLTLVVVVAIAAALVGGFRSYVLALLGAIGIGIAQSEVGNYWTQAGVSTALPFVVLVIFLVIRGKGLPVRGVIAERFAKLGTGEIHWPALIITVGALVVLILTVFSAGLLDAVSASVVAAILMLSVVVVTGYAGQLSLAQYALGGMSALIAGRLVAAQHWPFDLALLAGVVGAVLVGLVFAIPALRTRGVNLAAVTLGLGLALQAVVFSNLNFTGGDYGTQVNGQKFFGIGIDPIEQPRNYTILVVAMFVLCALAVTCVRRGRAGRRLLAVRANERAAAALGISVVGAKLYAFALSAAIAGIGGTLLAFGTTTIDFTTFDPISSIYILAYAVIGGVGFVIGPLFGATLVAGGVGNYVFDQLFSGIDQWVDLIGGVSLLVLLLQSPDGMAEANIQLAKAIGRWLHLTGRQRPIPPLPAASRQVVEPGTVEVSDLTVRFGGVVAVNGVSLTIKSGQIIGLIGPNGAGKTTLIDAITGFVRPAGGTISLNGRDITKWSVARRARGGVSRSFQSLELFEDITIQENLRAASDPRDRWSYLTNLVHPGNKPLPPSVVAAIREFGLEDDLNQRPPDLPYGRRRLAAVARAVAVQPSILLLDEPAAGLDDSETAELAELVRRLANEWGFGILLVEHDLSFVMGVCDEVTVLDFGNQIALGPPEAVSQDPAVIAAYIGDFSQADESNADRRDEQFGSMKQT